MGQRDGDLFMIAKNNFRRMIAAVVDQRIVQAPESGAGIDRDVLELECFEHIDDHIGAPLGARLFDLLCFGHSKFPS